MGVSRAETRQRWQARLARFTTADLTVAEFCAQEGVSTASFYLWRRKSRALAAPIDSRSASTPRFLPLALSGAVPSSAWQGGPSLDLELPNQVRLRMPREIEAEFVGQLLLTVAALGPHGLSAPAAAREAR